MSPSSVNKIKEVLFSFPPEKEFTLSEALAKIFSIPPERQTVEMRRRMSRALKDLGYKHLGRNIYKLKRID